VEAILFIKNIREIHQVLENFLPSVEPSIEPVLYQHLTDTIFEILVQSYCQMQHLDEEVKSMQQNEHSALRYIAGFTCHHMRKKIEKENDELMILCLMSLVKDKEDSTCGIDEGWTNSLDQGDLWHVKENTYQLFCAIEYCTRPLVEMLTKPSSPSKATIISEICNIAEN